jgi:hypothetical protein
VAYINPYRLFFGLIIPNWLFCRKEISAGAKLCYALLLRHAGDSNQASPTRETLAGELGACDRSVRRYILELANQDMIKVVRRGRNESNVYFVLSHPWQSENDQEGGQ